MSREELTTLLDQYGDFWDSDGRHSIWIHSPADGGTPVYDRHNLIYCYGHRDRFIASVVTQGFEEALKIDIPAPHQHSYVAEFDDRERELVQDLDWQRTDLHEGDE